MGALKWIVGWMVTLINRWADQATIKSLKQDIPSASLQGRADAPKEALPNGWYELPIDASKVGTTVIYGATFTVTPDRPAPDPYITRVREQYTPITGAQVASRFPEGS